MRKFARVSFCVFACCCCFGFPAWAGKPELKRDILGLRLEMPKAEVQKRLQEIGKLERTEEKGQEIWQVKDARFSHVAIGFDKKEMLRYVTAVARVDKEGKTVGYGEIGDPTSARQVGDPKINNFIYEWSLPAEKGDPEMLVIVRGRDPKFLSTYSLKRVGGEMAEDED